MTIPKKNPKIVLTINKITYVYENVDKRADKDNPKIDIIKGTLLEYESDTYPDTKDPKKFPQNTKDGSNRA